MNGHETGHISANDAEKVYWENVRVNQIGGGTDGISPEVAEDIGYFPPRNLDIAREETADHISEAQQAPKNKRPIVGPVRGEVDVHDPDYFSPPVVLSEVEKAEGLDRVRKAREALTVDIPTDQSRDDHQ